jgi:two-component system nitrate/nitrite response regulator NarL
VSLIVLDDHHIVAESLVIALRGKGFDAHRIPVTTAAAMLAAAAERRPGLALLDLDLGAAPDGTVLDGVELIGPLTALGWPVLVVTGTTNPDRISAAIAHGALNWVTKSADFDHLVDTATRCAAGEGALPRERRAELVARHREAQAERHRAGARLRLLSKRERAVLDRLAGGLTPAAIAQESHNSPATIRNQIHAILTKLEVRSQIEAVAIANRHG